MWHEKAYLRMLIDNHITDILPSFMAKFDPVNYVSMVKKSGVDSIVVCACCHNGNCYYPTKVGHIHKNLDGRDIFGQTVNLLKKEGIIPIAYYSTLFNNDVAKTHPEWRFRNIRGEEHLGRYWLLCANSHEYRQYCKTQIAEIMSYDINGFFIDMTFWQGVCVCHRCRKRYLVEQGREIPSVIDWSNSEWVRFQRYRENWIAEYAEDLSNFIKSKKPNLTVTHNFAPVLKSWYYAQSPNIADVCDYASGDFYGGKDQQRFGTKVMAAFSKNPPYEWMTSQCVTLQDHTSLKSKEEVFCSAATTLSNGGAHLFVDAINPDGTLSTPVYDQLEEVTKLLNPFKKKVREVRPVIVADTGLYFSMASQTSGKFDGKSLAQIPDDIHFTDSCCIDEILGTSIILNNNKYLYRVLTESTQSYGDLKTIIINNAEFLSESEIHRIRKFVNDGGTLIATGMTSYYDLYGKTSGDFALSDVFGVSYTGAMSKQISYLAMENDSKFVFCNSQAPLVEAVSANVLGKVAEPFFDPGDIEKYSAIHSDPFGPVSKYAGLTINSFGKGTCIYLYSSLLALQHTAQQLFGKQLLKKFISSSIIMDTNAPHCVEITLMKGMNKDSYLLSFVNYQPELPNIPIYKIRTTLKLPDNRKPKSCRTVSNGEKICCELAGSKLTFEIPCLDTFEMIEME